MAKSRAEYNAYMRVYMKKRYYRRRAVAIELLGGVCAAKGCTETKRLEIDHRIPSRKSFTLGVALAGWAWKRILKELKKCQLLCRNHHELKTIRQNGMRSAKGTHGTLSACRYCKPLCDLCRDVKNSYHREWVRKHKEMST